MPTNFLNKIKTKRHKNCKHFKIVKRWPGGYDWKCKLGPIPLAEECENYKRKKLKFFRPK